MFMAGKAAATQAYVDIASSLWLTVSFSKPSFWWLGVM